MVGHRGILTLGVFVCLALVGLGAWHFVDPPLAPPETADQAGLARWLLRDLAHEPPAVQAALVDRLQTEFFTGAPVDLPLADASRFLSQRQLALLARNASLLKQVWFRRRVAEYAGCAPEQRAEFLERQIAVLFRWLEIDGQLFADGRDAGVLEMPLTVGEFFQEVDGWMAAAQGPEHEHMITGVRDAVAYWLATRTLADQAPETVHALALHIAADLATGPPSGNFGVPFSAGELKQLQQNGYVLMEAWFREQAQRYAELPGADRAEFVAQRVNDVKTSHVMELLQGPSAQGAASSPWEQWHSALAFLALANRWIEHAPDKEKPTLTEFLGAFQAHYSQAPKRERQAPER